MKISLLELMTPKSDKEVLEIMLNADDPDDLKWYFVLKEAGRINVFDTYIRIKYQGEVSKNAIEIILKKMRGLILTTFILIVLSYSQDTIAEFGVKGNLGDQSSIILFQDSTYKRIVKEEGKVEEEFGKWKGSFALDSILVIYIELDDGSILCSYKYRNISDTLVLIEWSIQ